MKLLYLSTWDFTNEEADGVCKKIYSQIAVFEKNGYKVDLVYIKDGRILYKEDGNIQAIGMIGTIKKTPAYIKMYKFLKNKKYDWVYNRYGMMDTFYYRVLKRLHKNGARILIEIPTYPYVGEKPKGILYRFMFWWDELYLHKLKRIVERILTYSQDNEIAEVQTIQIANGINFSDVVLKKQFPYATGAKNINIIAVANVLKAHGYDRLLNGLGEYIKGEHKVDILFHLVGGGALLPECKELIKKQGLEQNVVLYGEKYGKELDDIFEKCDIAVESLGDHRNNVKISSSLKSREYVARGIPFITACKMDVFENEKFILTIPSDETNVDLYKVVEYLDELYHNKDAKEIAYMIREKGKEKCDIFNTMKPVLEYMREE